MVIVCLVKKEQRPAPPRLQPLLLVNIQTLLGLLDLAVLTSMPLVYAALNAREKRLLEVQHESEALALAPDARHAPVQEHECEVLRLAFAEVVHTPNH